MTFPNFLHRNYLEEGTSWMDGKSNCIGICSLTLGFFRATVGLAQSPWAKKTP